MNNIQNTTNINPSGFVIIFSFPLFPKIYNNAVKNITIGISSLTVCSLNLSGLIAAQAPNIKNKF